MAIHNIELKVCIRFLVLARTTRSFKDYFFCCANKFYISRLYFYYLMLLLQSLTYYVGQTLYEVNNINCLSKNKVFYGITTTVAQDCILWFAVKFTTITEEFQWKNRFIKTKLNKYCCLNPTQYDHCLQRWQWKWYRCK